MSDAPEDRLVCPNCQHENAKGAQQCEECGSSLVITVPVPPSAPEKNALVKAEIKPDEAPALPPNTVTLLIAGQAEPVIIPIQPEIFFGRSAPGEPQPTVDLSKYNGHMLGVSRNHAKMVATASGFTLEDLGSANGTWLNENRLTQGTPRQVNGGDQIRFGHMIAFVYFAAVDVMVLVDAAGVLGSHHKLTPRELTNTVGPLLVALTDIQHIVSTVQGRPQPEASVKSISVLANNSLQVKLEGVSEALKLVREQVMPWKTDNATLIAQFQGGGPMAPTRSLSDDERDQNEERRNSFRSVESHLAKSLVERLAPHSPESEKAEHAEKLVMPLETIILSGLVIADRSAG